MHYYRLPGDALWNLNKQIQKKYSAYMYEEREFNCLVQYKATRWALLGKINYCGKYSSDY